MIDMIFKQVHNAVDPSTVHGAIMINVFSGIVVTFICGFFAGVKYKEFKIKKARIDVDEVNDIEQGVIKGRTNSAVKGNSQSSEKVVFSDYSINAGTVHGNIKQDVKE